MVDARESNVTNLFSTTLSSQVGPTDLTFPVASMTGAPASPCFIFIRSVDGTQWEIIDADGTFTGSAFVATSTGKRYLTGSSAASGLTHESGAIVEVRAVAQLFQQIHDRIDATLPLAGGTMTGAVSIPDGTVGAPAIRYASDPDTGQYKTGLGIGWSIGGAGVFSLRTTDILPGADDTMDIGTSSLRWDDVYATNGTIQTSDVSVKRDIEQMGPDDAVAALRIAREATIRFRHQDGSRVHTGFDAALVGDIVGSRSAAFIDPGVGAVAPDHADYEDDEAYRLALAEYEARLDAPVGLRGAELVPYLFALAARQQQQIDELSARLTNRLPGGL